MQINFKKYLPHAVAVALFAIITLVYFKPLLSGKELRQHDIAMHRGMSKEVFDYRDKFDTEPLWTNSMFGGMPAYQISTLYPGNWLGALDKVFKLFLPHPGGYLFLYCFGFFILLLCLEVDPWLALIGGLAYGLSSYFLIIIQAGHNSKANALGYLPALLGGIVLLFRGRLWLGLCVTSLFTAMELNANHVQIAYYGYIVVAFLIAGYFFIYMKEKRLPAFFKPFLFFLLACLIGILPNAGNLLTTNEYGKLSNRGKAELTINSDMSSNKNILSGGLDKDYATHWSYGIGETFTFLIPDFKGGGDNAIGRVDPKALKKVDPEMREMVSQSNPYFGDQPGTSGPVYIGVIVAMLALIGMFIIKNPVKWPLFFVTLLTIPLSWGHNFMGLTSFFMDFVPGYNKFRAVSMILVVAELTLPLLAVLAINEMLKFKSWNDLVHIRTLKKDLPLKRLIFIVCGVVGGFCALSYLVPDMLNTFHATGEEDRMIQSYVRAGYPEDQVRPNIARLMPEIETARKEIFRSDALRSLIFAGLAFLSLFLYFTGKINRQIFFASIGFFIFIDLWTVDRRYLNDRSFITKAENQQYISGKTEADEEILRDTTQYRVLNLTVSPFDDASTSFYHHSVGGYHGAKLRRYVDLIDFHIRPEMSIFSRGVNEAAKGDSALRALFSQLRVLNMLNTKYIILPVGEEGDRSIPLKNPVPNGNVWFVNSLKMVQSPDSEIVGLKRIDTKTEAIINTEKNSGNFKNSYSGKGSIELVSYLPNDLVYKCESSEEQFAVFSEIYYAHGWNAYVDGQLTPHFQVNYVLRGMPVPAGKHTIEFKFEPAIYKTGNTIAGIGSALLLLTCIAGIYLERRNKVKVS